MKISGSVEIKGIRTEDNDLDININYEAHFSVDEALKLVNGTDSLISKIKDIIANKNIDSQDAAREEVNDIVSQMKKVDEDTEE